MTPSKAEGGWSAREGIAPHDVLVFEHTARNGTLYLRWWDAKRRTRAGTLAPNWRTASLGVSLAGAASREAHGQSPAKARRAAEAWARGRALAKHLELTGQAPGTAAAAVAPLSILDGLARATDPVSGKYIVRTPYVADIEAAVKHAATVWNNGPWNAVDLDAWERFWRARIRAVQKQGKAGVAAARHGVERVHAVARWLRDRRLIDHTAAVLPSDWRDEIARDYGQIAGSEVPDAHRPRYTLDEARRLLAVAGDVDPRLALLIALGAELRAGQVLRAERRDLVLDAVDMERTGAGIDAGEFGRFIVRGKGNKRGVTIDLTPGQRTAVDHALTAGYLRALEADRRDGGNGYALFPGGRLTTRSGWRQGTGSVAVDALAPRASRSIMSHSTASTLLRLAEHAADIRHAPGRGFHGMRRAYVDGAADLQLSAEGLMQLGGWTDERTPKTVYRDRELVQGRTEARDARAKLRGES